MLSSGSTVCNARVRRSFLSDGRLDAGKAANLFSASRRFKALASLAVAHSGIVFLLLHLSLLPGSGKGSLFTELAAPDSSSADRHEDWLLGTFWASWGALGKIPPSVFISEGKPQKLPWEGKLPSSHLTCREGRCQSESSHPLAWARVSLVLPEVEGEEECKVLAPGLRSRPSDADLRPLPGSAGSRCGQRG